MATDDSVTITKPELPTIAPAPQPAAQTPTPDQTSKPKPFKLSSTKSVERYLKMMIYGDYGTGKTTFAGSSEDVKGMKDVLVIDAESGNLSLANRNIDVIPVREYSQFARVHEFLRLHCKYRDEKNKEALIKLETMFRDEEVATPKVWRTVVIDSLSEVQKYCMYQLLGIKIGEQKLDLLPDSPEFKEWGQSAEMIRLLVRSFRDLPMNVIFVCSQRVEQDEQKKMHYGPALPGKLANEVQGFLDVVGYLAVDNRQTQEGLITTRRLFIQPSKVYQAKNRLTQAPVAYIDDPTMQKLIDLKS